MIKDKDVQKIASAIRRRRELEAKASSGGVEAHKAHYRQMKSMETSEAVKEQTLKNRRLLNKY